jgi:hypothetical protein
MTATTTVPSPGYTAPMPYCAPTFDDSSQVDAFPFQPTRPQQVVPDPYPRESMRQSAPAYQTREQQPPEREASRSRLDQTRYWVGAAITAAIAAVTAVLGTIIAHSILHIPVLSDGTGATHTLAYALSAAGIAIAAAGLYNAMLHFAPRPRAFFGALSGALIALAVLVPFAITLPLGTQAAFALMNLAVAVVIAILVPLAATNARR